MYTIGHMIYGAPITKEICALAEERDEEIDVHDGGYFTDLYNGGGEPAGYIGIELTTFDECSPVNCKGFSDHLTSFQVAEVTRLLDTLPKPYRDILPDIGRWIVWGTS